MIGMLRLAVPRRGGPGLCRGVAKDRIDLDSQSGRLSAVESPVLRLAVSRAQLQDTPAGRQTVGLSRNSFSVPFGPHTMAQKT